MKKRTEITIYVVVGALLIGFAIWYFAIPSPTPKREVPKVTTMTTVEQKLNVRVDSLESRIFIVEAKLKQLTTSQPTQVDTTPVVVPMIQPPLATDTPDQQVVTQSGSTIKPEVKIPKYKNIFK